MPTAASPSLAYVTPTICELLGIGRPSLSQPQPCEAVVERARSLTKDGRVERCLIYAPDAIGKVLHTRHPQAFDAVRRHAPIQVEPASVLPTKTPVCFATMFTGAGPEAHGIRRYKRPVLTCDTLFDALLRAGKRPAIATVRESSIDLLFRGRELDHFSEEYDSEVTERVLGLIERGEHDFILAYHQEYDDALHRTNPYSDEALAAFRRHLASFVGLAEAAAEHWSDRTYAIVFAPDHGAHTDPETGTGSHGSDLPEDMELLHFWGIYL